MFQARKVYLFMECTVKRIDERNGLHGYMIYQISCGLPGFFAARDWCWKAFGAGIEREHYLNYLIMARTIGIEDSMPRWCWDSTKWRGSALRFGKIYLLSDEEMVPFSSKWMPGYKISA